MDYQTRDKEILPGTVSEYGDYKLKAYKMVSGNEEAYSIGMGFTLIKTEKEKEENGK